MKYCLRLSTDVYNVEGFWKKFQAYLAHLKLLRYCHIVLVYRKITLCHKFRYIEITEKVIPILHLIDFWCIGMPNIPNKHA